MFSALKKWAKGGNEDSKLSTPMGVRAMGQALQRKFARGIQYNLKIIIKGDRNTGKSCLFQRLQGRPFNEQYIPTNEIQVASIHWNYRTTDDVVKVEVWDVVDKGRSKKSSLSGLKLENDKTEGEKDATVLDAEFVDVYKGAHGVLMTMDITKPWTFKYIERELPKVPPHIPVLVLANHRDMEEHRLVQTDEAVAFIEHLERPDRCPPVHYAETSMKNGFGLKYIHKFLNLPFLLLQRETLLKQLQVNAEDMESTLEELQIHKETEEQDYYKFVSMLDKRKKHHEAKKAAAAAAATESDGQQSPSSATFQTGLSDETPATAADSSLSSDGTTKRGKALRRALSGEGSEARQGAVPQNGVTHSATNIDEFVPDDELDTGFLDEDKSGGRKRTNKPATKKPPPKVEVEPDVSEESESDSDTRNPMVAGFAEDIDSEDETTGSPPITNHINEDLNSPEFITTNKKSSAVITVQITSSEEDEKEDRSDEEEKRNAKEKSGRKSERTNVEEDIEIKSESSRLNLEMPDKSGMNTEVDVFGVNTEDVDDWFNSQDLDPKASPIVKEHTVRKVDTRSQASPSASAAAIPMDEWEKFMASQMQPQPKGSTTTPNSLIDMSFDGEGNDDAEEESKTRRKKEHRSGEKSKTKHKQRKHKDKSEEGADSEKKERRKSRHKEGEEGKDRRKSRDDEGEKKKKRRSKHSRTRSEEGEHDGETYAEL